MEKVYDRIDWHNNTSPDINENNLNRMSKALDDLDDRVISIAGNVLVVVPEILEKYADIEALATNPPYIGQNGHWWTWDTDTNQYVDSGVDAGVSLTIGETTTLDPNEDATVENVGTATDPILNFGIPKGATGSTGPTGATPNITATATVDAVTGTPSVNVTQSGTAENPSISFAFHNLKGAKGDTGATGQTGPTGQGVPTGGTTGQVLKKKSNTDYDTEWSTSDDGNAYHTTDTAETTLADGDYFPFYDTSATAKRKTLWSNIKSVLKTYFDSLYSAKATSKGSATKGVYFDANGAAQEMSYTVGKSVPSNAVFTDANVLQTNNDTSYDDYFLLYGNSSSTATEGTFKSSKLKFSPSQGNLQTQKINGVMVSDSPKFTDSGHTILNGSGSAMTQRSKLQFVGADVTDDSANDKTIVTGTPQSMIGDAWASGQAYAVGDYRIDGNVLYKCKTAHTSSASNRPPYASYWEVCSVATELKKGLLELLNPLEVLSLRNVVHKSISDGDGETSVSYSCRFPNSLVVLTGVCEGNGSSNAYVTIPTPTLTGMTGAPTLLYDSGTITSNVCSHVNGTMISVRRTVVYRIGEFSGVTYNQMTPTVNFSITGKAYYYGLGNLDIYANN